MKGNVDWNNIIDELTKLRDEGYDLADALENDYDNYSNDWCKMLRYADRLRGFRYQLFVFLDFHNLRISMENEKDRFEVQKVSQFHNQCFQDDIESFIHVSRQWNMRDYRCRRYQERMEKFFSKLQEIVSEKKL